MLPSSPFPSFLFSSLAAHRCKSPVILAPGGGNLVTYVINQLKNPELFDPEDNSRIRSIVARLIGRRQEDTVDNCVKALSLLMTKIKPKTNYSAIIDAMKSLFSGNSLHSFCMSVISENVLGNGALHATARLNYFLHDAEVLFERIFTRTDGQDFKVAVTNISREEVMETVMFASRNYANYRVVQNLLSSKECFQRFDFNDEQVAKRWRPASLKKYVVSICKMINEPIPAVTRPLLVTVGLKPLLASYLGGDMEEQDFYVSFRGIIGSDPVDMDVGIRIIKAECLSLASYVARRSKREAVDYVDEFVPACCKPFNKNLHSLPGTGEVVVKNKTDVVNFVNHLKQSRSIAIDFHGCPTADETSERLGFIAFRFERKVFFVMPFLFADTVKPIAEALRSNEKKTFAYRWDRRGKPFSVLFGWKPRDVTDIAIIAKDANVPASLDSLVERTVGGTFCRRASNFGDLAIPSSVALHHAAIRVAVVFGFASKMLRPHRGLSSSNADPSASRAGPAASRTSLSASHAGPAASRAGPSSSDAGPSIYRAGHPAYRAGHPASRDGHPSSRDGPSGRDSRPRHHQDVRYRR